jgi:hypothetical protein
VGSLEQAFLELTSSDQQFRMVAEPEDHNAPDDHNEWKAP